MKESLTGLVMLTVALTFAPVQLQSQAFTVKGGRQ